MRRAILIVLAVLVAVAIFAFIAVSADAQSQFSQRADSFRNAYNAIKPLTEHTVETWNALGYATAVVDVRGNSKATRREFAAVEEAVDAERKQCERAWRAFELLKSDPGWIK